MLYTEEYLELKVESSMFADSKTLLGTNPDANDHFKEFSDLMTSIQGRHFTPSSIYRILSSEVEEAFLANRNWKKEGRSFISICDPFAGDGRLALSALEDLYKNPNLGVLTANVDLWDIQFESTDQILEDFSKLDSKYGTKTTVRFDIKNTFLEVNSIDKHFDLVITNPPWATVKPKKNKGTHHDPNKYLQLIQALRDFDRLLEMKFPFSQPSRKFAGWGTNLSRVGCELASNLVANDGVLAIVLPVSFLADEASIKLRKFIFSKLQLRTIDIFSAESKLFEFADVGVASVVGSLTGRKTSNLKVRWHEKEICPDKSNSSFEIIELEGRYSGQSLPVNFGKFGIRLQGLLNGLSDFESLEKKQFIWAGRELDETGIKAKLKVSGDYQLAKGGNISSFSKLGDLPWLVISSEDVPRSVENVRIGWRDVSRASQKRRMIATLIPKGVLTGNSLNVTHVKTEPREGFTFWLLAVMSSLVFETQLRASLATDHVSLSAVRKILIPDFEDERYEEIVRLSKISLADGILRPSLEYQVALAYGLDAETWKFMIDAFPKLTEIEREALMNEWV